MLKNECETRWGSTYDAIERFLEQEKAVRSVLTADYYSTHLLLTGEDISTLESILNGLKPVYEFTDMLSGKFKL